MNKKNLKNAIMAGSLVGVIAISGAFAYLTDTDEAVNTFTVGDVKIDLVEDKWDAYEDTNDNQIPDVAEDIWAGKIIEKDPKVLNTGNNDSYIYLEVTIPKASVITTDADGNVLNGGAATYQELFSLQYIDAEGNVQDGVNPDWTMLEETESNADDADGTGRGTVTRLYAFKEAVVAETGVTSTLFDKVTFVNLKDNHDQIPQNTAQDIEIVAHAIQSNFGDGSEASTPAAAWELYSVQNQHEKF